MANEPVAEWTFDNWLESLSLQHILAEPFEMMLEDQRTPGGLRSSAGRRAFICALATYGCKDLISAMLRSAPLLASLSTIVWDAVVDFKAQCDLLAEGARRARDEQDRIEAMLADDSVEVDCDDPSTWGKMQPRLLTFGQPSLFFSTLSDAVGRCAADGLIGMTREHTVRPDSDLKFCAPNYNIQTTSKLEWYIVAEPEKALVELGLDEWPAGGGHTPIELGFRHVNAPTSPFFTSRIKDVNERLAAAGDSEKISLEHFCALRMYTGPMYMKYNFILRGAYDEFTVRSGSRQTGTSASCHNRSDHDCETFG